MTAAPLQPRPEAVDARPELLIESPVYDRLHALATDALDTLPIIAADLLAELERARLLAPGTLPRDVATIGSLLSYRDLGSGAIRSLRLVWPAAADVATMQISVLTPLGAALIGLREGQQIDWRVREGEARRLELIRVHGPGAGGAGPV